MAIDFPASPTPGQVYGNYYWDSSKQAWRSNNTTHMSVITSTTAPTGVVNGDMWFNSTDGTMYIYYDNGITSQWVEFKANSYLGSTLSARVDQLEIKSQNYIINGGFDIWQRGTSSSAQGYATADRWYQRPASGVTFSQASMENPAGSKYVIKLLTTSSSDGDIFQSIETSNATLLQGKAVTFSAYVSTDTAANAFVRLDYATADDQGPLTGTWVYLETGIASVSSSGWTRITVTANIPATARTIRVRTGFYGTHASGTSLYITGAQLEEGSVATPFRRNQPNIQGELAACQRYYEKTYALATVPGTATAVGFVDNTTTSNSGSSAVYALRFAVTKRIAPVMTAYSIAGTINVWNYSRSGASGSPTAVFDNVSEMGCRIYVPIGAAWAAVDIQGHWIANAEL